MVWDLRGLGLKGLVEGLSDPMFETYAISNMGLEVLVTLISVQRFWQGGFAGERSICGSCGLSLPRARNPKPNCLHATDLYPYYVLPISPPPRRVEELQCWSAFGLRIRVLLLCLCDSSCFR